MDTSAWTTEEELEYLKTIGKTTECCKGISKLKMLEGYMRGFNKRSVWNDIDRKTIQIAVARKIKALRK